MSVWIAQRTLDAINAALAADGGNAYRRNLGRVLPHIGDAYRDDEDGYRTHLGASVIGGACERAVWYGYLWAHKRPPRGKKGEGQPAAEGRMLRLWNRGHLEEGRFIALLLTIGVQVFQQDANGKQFRMLDHAGHYSGSGDGFAMGVPDLPPGVPCLTEFKTHSEKSFQKLQLEGVRKAKPEHFTQMCTYMGRFGVVYALYVAVNKNTDELYAEIVMYDQAVDAAFTERARRLVFEHKQAPRRLRGAGPAYHTCKYLCDYPAVCFNTEAVDVNCRTCEHAAPSPYEGGVWLCHKRQLRLDKAAQLAACDQYQLLEAMVRD